MRKLLSSKPILPASSTVANISAAAASPETQPPTVDSDVVVILVALICALICIIGLALVARCSCLRRNADQSNSFSAAKSLANKGLNKKALKSLPKSIFHEQEESGGGGGGTESKNTPVECAICLERFGEGEEVRVLPGCGHGFHVVCVDAWLKSHSSCPSCRRLLLVGRNRCRKCGARDNGEAAAAGDDGCLP